MPQIVFTEREREQIDAVATELESTAQEFFAEEVPDMSAEERVLLMAYAQACVRRALEVGSLLHAIVDAEGVIPYPGRGRRPFVKAALEQWRDCFSPLPEIWRLAAVCEKVPGGEQRVKDDILVLEVMAANRMFASLDQEYQTFFRSTR